jgi:hypothetical protein
VVWRLDEWVGGLPQAAVAADEGGGGAVVLQVGGASGPSSAAIRVASTLPSSTPHWSKELTSQITPWVNTLCSYRAVSWPSTDGVSSGARMVLVGRFPGKVRCGARARSTPSASTCSLGFPKARASVWAKKLAMSRSWWSPTSTAGRQMPMKSHGISLVPWWISW